MLSFVAQNAERYKWDCYIYFKMHGILLDKWVNKMTYWGNRADELSLYALSDMLNMHTFVVTGSKPWTTIHPSVIGTELVMLDLCPVKLIHLGQYLFGKLVPKQPETNSSMPVYADAIPGTSVQELKQPIPLSTSVDNDITASEPNLPKPTPYDELETAHTLEDMTVQSGNLIEQQDSLPTNLPVSHPEDIEEPPISDYEPLTDAMDKLVNHPDVSFSDEKFWWIGTNFADHIITSEHEKNESDLLQTKIKKCTVVLMKLDPAETLPVKLPSLQTEQDLLDVCAYFTRSKRLPKKL